VRLPGATEWAFLKLYCQPERAVELLTGPLSDLLTLLEPALDKDTEDAHWWFTRYADPEPHLRIRLRTPDAYWAGTLIQAVGRWAHEQLEHGTIQGLAWDTDRPETGRYGAGPNLAVAEAVFAADSAATLAELRTDVGDLRPALTAASLLDIATHLLGGHQTALEWMVANLRQHAGAAPSRPLLRLALDLTEDTTPEAAPGRLGIELATAWERRGRALTTYRAALQAADGEPSEVVASLLHMHHNRVVGIDRTAEADCLRLIRTASLSWLARARQGALR
jgi:thiopeptide-type bacteriocin biosynthesis protein